jgi:hypothetical protein
MPKAANYLLDDSVKTSRSNFQPVYISRNKHNKEHHFNSGYTNIHSNKKVAHTEMDSLYTLI